MSEEGQPGAGVVAPALQPPPQSIALPMRDILCVMQSIGSFVKYGRKGRPSRRMVCLTSDNAAIKWNSESSKSVAETTILIPEIVAVQSGSSAPNFRRHKETQGDHSANCFSIVYVRGHAALQAKIVAAAEALKTATAETHAALRSDWLKLCSVERARREDPKNHCSLDLRAPSAYQHALWMKGLRELALQHRLAADLRHEKLCSIPMIEPQREGHPHEESSSAFNNAALVPLPYSPPSAFAPESSRAQMRSFSASPFSLQQSPPAASISPAHASAYPSLASASPALAPGGPSIPSPAVGVQEGEDEDEEPPGALQSPTPPPLPRSARPSNAAMTAALQQARLQEERQRQQQLHEEQEQQRLQREQEQHERELQEQREREQQQQHEREQQQQQHEREQQEQREREQQQQHEREQQAQEEPSPQLVPAVPVSALYPVLAMAPSMSVAAAPASPMAVPVMAFPVAAPQQEAAAAAAHPAPVVELPTDLNELIRMACHSQFNGVPNWDINLRIVSIVSAQSKKKNKAMLRPDAMLPTLMRQTEQHGSALLALILFESLYQNCPQFSSLNPIARDSAWMKMNVLKTMPRWARKPREGTLSGWKMFVASDATLREHNNRVVAEHERLALLRWNKCRVVISALANDRSLDHHWYEAFRTLKRAGAFDHPKALGLVDQVAASAAPAVKSGSVIVPSSTLLASTPAHFELGQQALSSGVSTLMDLLHAPIDAGADAERQAQAAKLAESLRSDHEALQSSLTRAMGGEAPAWVKEEHINQMCTTNELLQEALRTYAHHRQERASYATRLAAEHKAADDEEKAFSPPSIAYRQQQQQQQQQHYIPPKPVPVAVVAEQPRALSVMVEDPVSPPPVEHQFVASRSVSPEPVVVAAQPISSPLPPIQPQPVVLSPAPVISPIAYTPAAADDFFNQPVEALEASLSPVHATPPPQAEYSPYLPEEVVQPARKAKKAPAARAMVLA